MNSSSYITYGGSCRHFYHNTILLRKITHIFSKKIVLYTYLSFRKNYVVHFFSQHNFSKKMCYQKKAHNTNFFEKIVLYTYLSFRKKIMLCVFSQQNFSKKMRCQKKAHNTIFFKKIVLYTYLFTKICPKMALCVFSHNTIYSKNILLWTDMCTTQFFQKKCVMR